MAPLADLSEMGSDALQQAAFNVLVVARGYQPGTVQERLFASIGAELSREALEMDLDRTDPSDGDPR